MTELRAGTATDVGKVRAVNEDRFLVSDTLFAVADGLGGHQAGEVASQVAVETLAEAFTEHTTDGLIAAVERANEAVWNLASDHSDMRGMGTTLTAVALVDQDGDEQLSVVNVGDSRAYLFQRDELIQVTEDHSLVDELVRDGRLTAEEARTHPQRSVITRALGLTPDVVVDVWQLLPFEGDRLVLCSDGLTNEVTDDRIAAALRRLADPAEVAADLVRQAREGGGNDNITVVVIDIVDDGDRAGQASKALAAKGSRRSKGRKAADTAVTRSREAVRVKSRTKEDAADGDSKSMTSQGRRRRVTWRVVGFVLLVVVVLGGASLAIAWYARQTYFVGLNTHTARVAIFRGRPGGLLWFDPTLSRSTPLAFSDVPPARQQEVRDGHVEPSVAAAERYVAALEAEGQAISSARGPIGPTSTLPVTTTIAQRR